MKIHTLQSFSIFLLVLSVPFSIVAAQNAAAQENSGSLLETLWTSKEPQQRDEINLMMTGDIMLDRYIATLRGRAVTDQDPANDQFPFTFMPTVLEAVKNKLETDQLDLVLGNLEGPITDSTYVNNGTAMIFNFKPSVVDQLKNAGFTTFNMANNHTLDMGATGPQQTHDYLAAAEIDAFGHPDTPNGPYSFISYDFDGFTVGFLGFNDAVIKLDVPAALEEIKAVDAQVDVLILAVHWGIEYETTARDSVVEKAHQFIDAGVDFIWGTHPHVVQNSEIYNGKTIYYSLGNFVFDQYWSEATQKGLVLGLKIQKNDDGSITFTPKEVPVDLINKGEPTVSNE